MTNEAYFSLPQGLVLVGLPIGNDDDISLRALKFLGHVSYLACEDTRVIQRFLTQHRLPSPRLIPYHDHNGEQARPLVLEKLRGGETVGLVSDRGMPLISDPGYKLVEACLREDIPVTALPGPSSVLTALCLSGLPPDRFFFQGFLPRKISQQKTLLKELAQLPVTLIFFEAPRRLPQTLELLRELLGDRQAAVARELTKIYENVQRNPLSALIDYYEKTPAKGELVILVEGSKKSKFYEEAEVMLLLTQALEQSASLRDAVEMVAQQTGLPRRELYTKALLL
ncbi:MAG: 16S rRNA (cytidine(1402)-2'-O)-methyltransferase [Alphaproteobacteria bacterium]